MGTNVNIGLAVTSHDAALTCQAVFSNVTTTGSVGALWTNQDIGIASNAAEPLYVAVSNSAGTPAVVVHDDPAAAQIDTWTGFCRSGHNSDQRRQNSDWSGDTRQYDNPRRFREDVL